MEERYHKQERIGKGSYGEVYKGLDTVRGEPVAIKIMNLDTEVDEIADVQKEISVLSHCESPFITRYHGSYLKGSQLWVIMDYAEGGSMRNILAAGPIPERLVVVIVREVLKALSYLHKSMHIIHRDIKAANILLTGKGEVKLCDFGVAGQLSMNSHRRTSFVGSPFWMAPEIIQRSEYDYKADIWSLGITMIELLTGNPPFVDQHPQYAMSLISKSKPPRLQGNDFSQLAKDFVARCLCENPADRPSAAELLKHKFITSAASVSTSVLLELLSSFDTWKRAYMNPDSEPNFTDIQTTSVYENNLNFEWVFDATTPAIHSSLSFLPPEISSPVKKSMEESRMSIKQLHLEATRIQSIKEIDTTKDTPIAQKLPNEPSQVRTSHLVAPTSSVKTKKWSGIVHQERKSFLDRLHLIKPSSADTTIAPLEMYQLVQNSDGLIKEMEKRLYETLRLIDKAEQIFLDSTDRIQE